MDIGELLTDSHVKNLIIRDRIIIRNEVSTYIERFGESVMVRTSAQKQNTRQDRRDIIDYRQVQHSTCR